MILEINKNFDEFEIQNEKEHIIDESAFLEIQEIPSPIFSANEVGKITLKINQLRELTGYDYSKLPLENTQTQVIYNIFHDHPKLEYLPIINESGWISGYFTRKSFLSIISENSYNRELLFRKDVVIKDYFNENVVCLNAYSTLSEASDILMERPEQYRFDPFVVTLDRKFFGISTVDRVLKGINIFLKRDFDALEEAQYSLGNFFVEYEKNIKNPLEYVSFIKLLLGPGGDFVQKYEINNDYALVVLLDVCGKGLKASSMVFTFVSMFNKQLEIMLQTNSFNLRNFQKELIDINRDLILTTSPELYATGVFIIVHKKEKIISVYDFGHGLIWVKRKGKVHQLKINSSNQVGTSFFGIHDNINITPISFKLKEGDIVFSCSDGITEQMNYDKEMYITRLPDVLKKFDDELNKNKKLLLKDWTQFRQNRRIRDDVSFFMFKL